ncbi:MAG: endonuclease/exonuclease/phosphatase family protein [Candidatus Marinimicrobia bacterium]|nr:endonuclease/exonuclease/phosphatase family protein [Candidatus Neomarinimicrobiota bacterium]
MKYYKQLIVLCLSLLFLGACSSNSVKYTVMTYNIRHGLGMDRVLDLERTARVIRAVDPDILILNEMDHGTARSFGVLQADSLGLELNMHSVFGRSIDYDGGQYGNALLTKYPLIKFEVIDLSVDSLREGRSVFLAHLDLGSDTLIVMGTHLGLAPEEQQHQVARILQVIPDSPRLILTGDFNFEPDSDPYTRINEHLTDGILKIKANPEKTYPADKPARRIDYIFVGEDIKPVSSQAIQAIDLSTASDHYPQVLEFMIR